MKPLQELLKGRVVNCQTEEEAKEFLSFMHKNGYKWIDGTSLINMTCFIHGRLTCYNTNNVNNKISHSDEAYYKNKGYEVITYQQFKQLINNENMETKEVKIQVPEGYEIDKESSTSELIKFKPIKKVSTYEDVAMKLFFGKSFFFITTCSDIEISNVKSKDSALEPNNCTSCNQARKLLAINKLMNVAKYLNGDWKPNWNNSKEEKWFLKIDECNNVCTGDVEYTCLCNVFFKSCGLAKQAIEILGEETIKTALSTDW